MPRCLPFLASFFDDFLIDFCSQLRPPEPQKSSPRCSESTIFKKSRFEVGIDFGSNFGANLAPFRLQKSNKIRSKVDPKKHQNFDRFWDRFLVDFGSVSELKLDPSWAQVGQIFGSRRTQDASERSWRPRAVQDRILIDF